ncbi:hypothetical protein BC828DRAFT_403824 [Blastocladiella britannica]|nr:hypothetical protein BC828DRAFT_403824 [Blastocladiella britannica]
MALTLAQCVSNVVVTCSRDPVLAQCVASIVVGTQTAWSINLTTGSAQELVDSNGATLAQYLGTTAFTIVDANFSNEHCGTIAFLVLRSSGVYAIMTLEESSWNVKFQFPTTVPFYSPNSATPQLFNASSVIQYPMSITVTTTGSRPLTLNKILYSQMPTEELFIYGSALLFSPDGGNSMFLMDTLQAPLTVTSLESSYASYGYLYLTSDGTMNAGISSFPQSFPIGRAPSNTVALKFDSTEQPYALTWTAAGLARSNINWQAEWAPAILNAATASGAWTGITATCPYSSLYASGPLTPQYTRSATPVAANTATGAGPSTPRVNVQLPPAIYLDYKQSYVFTVDLSPPAGADLASIVMAFSISNPDLIGVLAVRLEIPAQNRVVYTVTVSDLGQYPAQVKPGADPSAAALTIEILKGESCAAAALGPLIVYVGCPPGLLLQVDPIPVSSMTCIDPVAEVPCLYMDADYKPTFSLWDQVTGTATPFQSPVTLTLIAGASATVKAPGLSTGSFAASQIAAINQYSWSPNMNVDLVQLADGRYVFPSGQGVNISWVCLTGSPCAGVTPPFPHPAEYYFSVHVSTIGVATGHSYCLLQSTYPVRLYGLSVDLATSLLATGISLAITVALVLMIAVYQRRKQVRANLMVAPVAEYPIGSGPHATIGRPFGSAGGAAHGGSTRPTSAQSGGSTAPLVGASGGGGDADGGSSSAVAPSTAPTTMPALRPILRARPAIPEDAEDQAMQ